MSIPEIIYRVKQQMQKQTEKLLKITPKYSVFNIETVKPILDSVDKENLDVFPDGIEIFGNKINCALPNLDWHTDYFTNKQFPKFFSKDISIRNNPELSVKNVWEINRLNFMPKLALNYIKTNNEKYLRQFVDITKSWNDQNPFLIGINWYSNIEINIRLINWFFCWEILDVEELIKENSWFKAFVEDNWLPVIYQHCVYSYGNPSKFSSANNHLISEYAGLFIASSKWQFKESSKWLEYSKKGLEKEIIVQHSNGINKEEAAEYIQFITDFFLLSYVVAEKTMNSFSINYKNVLIEIFDYILNFTDCNVNFPQYGDEDDGKVIDFSNHGGSNNFNSLLISAAIIFENEKYLKINSEIDLKNSILFGREGLERLKSLQGKKEDLNSKFYPDEGHFIFRKENKNKEIYLHFDAAPLGFLSIAAHGHSDALSFIMHINGQPIFIDPGTYSYHVEKSWRNYFVSSKAHNTITIDNKNQANHVSDTMWHDHYNCEILVISKDSVSEEVTAKHNGYRNVSHTRKISFDKELNTFRIIDKLDVLDKRKHKVFISFHLHPEINVKSESENMFTLCTKDREVVEFKLDEKLFPMIAEGEESPILGWYSKSFLQKEPTKVIYAELDISTKLILNSSIVVKNY